LLPARFKFFLVESKVTTLADALRRKILFKQLRYALEITSFGKMLGKE